MIRRSGIPYPSEEDLESGEFDDLADGECSEVWLRRLLLDVDDDGNVVATPELEKVWEEEEDPGITSKSASFFRGPIRQG